MKLLLLGINYDPEIISTAVYTTALAEDMARHGIETQVITAKPYYPQWRICDGWRGPFWRRRQSQAGVRIVHCPLYVPAVPTGAKRILHHASFALTALPVAILKGLIWRPDIVMVVAPSLLSAPVGRLAALLSGGKAWLHIQDFEVEAAFATGLLKEQGPAGGMARAFERWILQRFHRVSSISAPMVAKLGQKGVVQRQAVELRNWANLPQVSPMDGVSPLRAQFGINTRHIALYSGNLSNKQGLSILPEMARHLSHRKDLTIAICGDGPMRQQLERESATIGNIRFFPLQPVERLNDLLGMADVHLLPQISEAADLVLPSKLTNMLASGRPMLVTATPDTALGREVVGAGCLVPPGDSKIAAQTLEAMLDAPEERARMGRTARRYALERCNMDEILGRLRSEMQTLVGSVGQAREITKEENA